MAVACFFLVGLRTYQHPCKQVPTFQGVGSATIFSIYIIHPSLISYSQNEELASLFEESVTPYQPTCPHIPEDLCCIYFVLNRVLYGLPIYFATRKL